MNNQKNLFYRYIFFLVTIQIPICSCDVAQIYSQIVNVKKWNILLRLKNKTVALWHDKTKSKRSRTNRPSHTHYTVINLSTLGRTFMLSQLNLFFTTLLSLLLILDHPPYFLVGFLLAYFLIKDFISFIG